MNAKAYLQQLKMLNIKITETTEDLEQTNALLTKVTSAMCGEVVSQSKEKDTMTAPVAKLIELKKKLERNIVTFTAKKEKILNVLSKVENPDYYKLLHSRYVLYKTWEDIAEEMNISCQWVWVLHGRALLEVKSLLEENVL
jgi:DNA-directed RNA polymerase specialized sigma subunit